MFKREYVELLPSSTTLIESLRSIGYSLETSIADILDNSITAKAKRIDIFFDWNAGKPWVVILDDGIGMNKAELIDSMRFGSLDPKIVRTEDDLGRFGLGLKTASFSQCRKLVVVSWQNAVLNASEWDLDWLIAEKNASWQLRLLNEKEVYGYVNLRGHLMHAIEKSQSGTLVYWDKLDRFEQFGAENEKSFNEAIMGVRNHLELVFHRFLEDKLGRKRFKIFMNNAELSPFNPFFTTNNATQELPAQKFFVEGEKIEVQPYVLPHHNKVSRQDWEKYAGLEGYLQNQGFYVYRNKRLIIKGTWFKLLKKEELNKLIRVRVDISNKQDHLWKIDIKKSKASPPESIRRELKKIISRIELTGKRVYRQRGQHIKTDLIPFWNRRAANNRIHFEINKEHPVFKDFVSNLPENAVKGFFACLNAIESSFPVESLYHDYANTPEEMSRVPIDEEKFFILLETCISFAKKPEGYDLKLLQDVEIFSSNIELVKKYFKEKHNLIWGE